jgi:hypothetical protein
MDHRRCKNVVFYAVVVLVLLPASFNKELSMASSS